jgi:nucleolar protein 56
MRDIQDHDLKSAYEQYAHASNVDASLLKEQRKPEHHQYLRALNILLAKKLIAESVNEDTLIIQSINAIEDLDRVCNTLSRRLREWYGYYFPELANHIQDNEIYARMILQKSKKEFMEEYELQDSMGPVFQEKDVDEILMLARTIGELYTERERLVKYIEDIMSVYCKNLSTLAGSMIGAKLLEHAGSLKRLIMMPSSTIQMLGAERALFRHLRNKKARPPKHGLILSHPFVMDAKKSERGAAARGLAAKLSIAARVDYFKGEFIADRLKEELEKK